MHGGSAPQVRRAAGRRLAVAEFAKSFGEPVADADPVNAALEEIRWAAGHVRWLRARVQETDPDALVWGLDQQITRASGEFPGMDTTHAAKASAWVVLYGQERDRLLRMCEIAARMGIEAKFVELAERTGALIGDLVDRLLGDLDLTPDQRQRATLRLPEHLRQLAASMNVSAN
jgi:hypothetical protein